MVKRKFDIYRIFLIMVIFLFAIISFKLVYVSVSSKVDGIDLRQFALSRTTETKEIVAQRGTIYDNLGEVLATNVRSYTVIAYLSESRTTDNDNPQHVVNKEQTANALSPLINMTPEYILKLLNYDAYQVELGPGGRGITELVKDKIEALDLPGIDFIKSSKRDYPYGDFASYIIGYAKKNDDEEISGEMGIELKYDDDLKGVNGSTTYQKDAYGYKLVNSPEITEAAKNGYDIYLTIDSSIQLYLENAMKEIKDGSYDWATMTIADAKTGAVVASSSAPSFNPNILEISNYNNILTSYTYEPGSTMKIFSFMAAMEEGLYDGDEKYPSGSINVDNFSIYDWYRKGWGNISYDIGFTYSSNTAAVRLAQKLGDVKLTDYYQKFGFGSLTGIELPNEINGDVDVTNAGYDTKLASASYGQGITTTPIQNIMALTSLANDGVVLKPYIISKIVNPDTGEIVYEGKKEEFGKAVSKSTVDKMIDLMDKTVNTNDTVATGYKYQTDAVRLIGKTGTAEYVENGSYAKDSNKTIRSFAGLFPKDDPEYIIYFSVKDYDGSSYKMANIVKGVVESIAKYKNLSEKESDIDNSKIVSIGNLINANVDNVKKELEDKGLNVVVIGDGETVINQYPLKGGSSLSGSKVFLLTSKSGIKMPDIMNWSRIEVIIFTNLIDLDYTMNGYGNVSSYSINAGEDIISGMHLDVNLGG